MPTPLIRYRLDPTGTNPDNLVVGELHDIGIITGTQKFRAVAPMYGPFFTESLQVYDYTTNTLLLRGQDYIAVELLQEASMRFGKEIASVILVKNSNVSTKIRVSYQLLGGLYQYSADKIAELYNKVINDDRPVDWTNILNKPTEYPPSLHNHLIKDVYGFEVLVAALERVRNAIVLSDVPAFEAVINYALAQIVSQEDIDKGENAQKLVNYERLLYAAQLQNFNTVIYNYYELKYTRNRNHRIDFTITNYMRDRALFWTIDHVTTGDEDFVAVNGIAPIDRQKSFLQFGTKTAIGPQPDKQFRISLRITSTTGPIIATSELLTLRGNNLTLGDDSLLDNYWLASHHGCMMKQELTPGRYYLLFMTEDLC